jgi:hypothetical protein
MSKLEQELNALGNNPLEIANKLMELGIRGEREDTCSCPIANYILALGYVKATVGSKRAGFWSMADEYDEYEECDIPDAVGKFIVAFDNGEFPELVK